jgi:general transcription factor IIIA
MANLEPTGSILKCECGRIHDCDRCPYVSGSRFFHQFPLFRCLTNSLEKYNCKDCDFGSDLVIVFNQHVREHHRKKIDEPKKDVEIKSYICHECSFETYSALVWIKHSNTLCFKIEEDFKKVTYGNNARLHLSREDVQWFRCDKCDYKAKHRYRVKHHKLIKHTSDEEALWLQCEQCSYKTKLKYSLRRHMFLHKPNEEANWFYCFNCEYRTRSKGNLRRHMYLKHTTPEAVQWLACDKCQYQCKTKDDLKKHTKLHHSDVAVKIKEDIEWARCDKCDFKAKHSYRVERHKRIKHTSDEEAKWIYCLNCEYRTQRKGNFRRQHVGETHHTQAVQWFACDKCQYQTKSNTTCTNTQNCTIRM